MPFMTSAALQEVPPTIGPDPAPYGSALRVRWWARGARVAVLAGTDLLVLVTCAAIAYLVWASPVRNQPASLYLGLLPFLPLFVLGYAQAGLYPGFGLGPVETLRRFSIVTSFAFVVLAALTFAVKMPHLYSRMTFGIAWSLGLVMLPAVRFAVISLLGRLEWWCEPVVLVGIGPNNRRVIETLRGSARIGYRPVGVLSSGYADAARTAQAVPVLGGLDLAPMLAKQGVRVALLESTGTRDGSSLDWLQQHFRHVMMIREYDHLPVEGVQFRYIGGVLGVEYTNNLLRPQNRLIKRLSDISLGTAALVLSLPVMTLAALLVKISSRGPVFYTQERSGLRGKPVKVHKIRTMHVNADCRLDLHFAEHPELRSEWERSFKLKVDPRLVPVIGPLLRRFSLDELPQLWSVITGEMSLVGPRPFPEYHLRCFSEDFRQLRHRVQPGITGLWQITVRSEGDIEAQEAFDSYYIRNWSIWLDIYILVKTVSAVLSGRGAY